MTVAIVVNAESGPRRRREDVGGVERRARSVLAPLGAEVRCFSTAGPGHARDLAQAAVADGADVVCAWGGDGTVNEVAAALASGPCVLAIVPVGSGNGFARDLGIPLDRRRALETAVMGLVRRVDMAVANGRPFVSTAGIGLDAEVARAFAVDRGGRRGGLRYVAAGLREARRFVPASARVVVDGVDRESRDLLLVTVANSRQWGNGARIAPDAKPDDGLLDVVTIPGRHPVALASQLWRLWTGTVGRIAGVRMYRGQGIRIECDRPLPIHVDGEPVGASATLTVSVTPRVLAVRVPR